MGLKRSSASDLKKDDVSLARLESALDRKA